MSERRKKEHGIDYVFARYPLWVKYSELPKQIGPVCWCILQRLLELRERFGTCTFFYPMEKLCATTGVATRWGLRKILDRLVEFKLISYRTSQGRSIAAQFEIIEPLNTPLSEEDVYKQHPRLRSKTYRAKISEEVAPGEKVSHVDLLGAAEKKDSNGDLLEKEKVSHVDLLAAEKDSGVDLSGEKKVYHVDPNKRIYIKRQQQQDLFHDNGDVQKSVVEHQPHAGSVVAFNAEILKEYGIAGEQASAWLKKYSSAYLDEKIEIIEYKRYYGEPIRNSGGMLKKAIEEDWQPPQGFITRAQREENARREFEAQKAAVREAAAKEARLKQERDMEALVDAWRASARDELLKEVHDRARGEVTRENPGTDERWLKPLVRIRERRIIAEDYVGKERMGITHGH